MGVWEAVRGTLAAAGEPLPGWFAALGARRATLQRGARGAPSREDHREGHRESHGGGGWVGNEGSGGDGGRRGASGGAASERRDWKQVLERARAEARAKPRPRSWAKDGKGKKYAKWDPGY